VRSFDGRLLGQTWETPFIEVPGGPIDGAAVTAMIGNFHQAYATRTGNAFEDLPVQGVTYRVQARLPAAKVEYPGVPVRASGSPVPARSRPLAYLFGGDLMAGEYQRGTLRCHDVIAGPAIVAEDLSTTLIMPGQIATVGPFGELRVTRKAGQA
jgi:N-methylhydantoinase A